MHPVVPAVARAVVARGGARAAVPVAHAVVARAAVPVAHAVVARAVAARGGIYLAATTAGGGSLTIAAAFPAILALAIPATILGVTAAYVLSRKSDSSVVDEAKSQRQREFVLKLLSQAQ